MKLRNLISAALLVGVGSTALPAAAGTWHTTHPGDMPANCSVTLVGGPLPRDIHGNTGPSQPYYIVRCTSPTLPSWMTW